MGVDRPEQGNPCLAVLASDEPLAARLQSAAGIPAALIEALLGHAREAQRTLLRAGGASPPPPRDRMETAWAFVLVETGSAAQAAANAHFAAVESPREDFRGTATARLVLAQAIAAQGRLEPARRLAARVLAAAPDGASTGALRAYAALTLGSLCLDLGEVDAAREAARTAAAVSTGLLAARTDVLLARVAAAGGRPAEEANADLSRGLERLSALGARRDLALALLFRATAQLDDRPGAALAVAQGLLTSAGSAPDLALVRNASRLSARTLRKPVKPCPAIPELLDYHRRRVAATVCAVCNAGSGAAEQPCARLDFIDDVTALVAQIERQPTVVLERCLIDRARVGQLLAAAQGLAGFTDPWQAIAAIPRIALSVCSGESAQVIQCRRGGAPDTLSSHGPGLQAAEGEVAAAVRAALAQAGREHAAAEETALAVLPLREAGADLALVVAAAPPGTLSRADRQRLEIYASLAASTLARTRAAAELRETAARDAATLGAIADGLLAVGSDGIVRSANQVFACALGVRREDLVGRRLTEVPGLLPLAAALARKETQLAELVELPKGEFVLHAYGYDGGTIATLREAAVERQIARRLIGSVPRFTFDHLVGDDPEFRAVIANARRIAATDLPVLIGGESGTGKELLAQAIHNASPRASAPFLAINVTAIPHELLESELFGYEEGAFTGARSGGQAGKFELAGRGTIVLDEIGDMPPDMQGKLLRVLQEHSVQRLGGSKEIPVRARVIATTHRDLEAAVREGRFRLDLFHRLRVVHLHLPPLRSRPGDIRRIAQHHLAQHAARTGVQVRLAPAVLAALEAHRWPGNVRELVNLLECELGLLAPGVREIAGTPRALAGRPPPPIDGEGVLPLVELERRACQAALRYFGGNVSRAAGALGVSRATLYAKIKLYRICADAEDDRADAG